VEKWRKELVFFLNLSHLLLIERYRLHWGCALVHRVQVRDAGDVVVLRILLRAFAGLISDEAPLQDVSYDTVKCAVILPFIIGYFVDDLIE